MVNVMKARKEFDIKYPLLYAPESHKNAKEFNCVQRAHQNTLESLSMIMILMIINGLHAPKISASFGLVWVIGRVLYGYGYKKNGAEGRKMGGLVSHLGDFPLILMTFYTAYRMINTQPDTPAGQFKMPWR